MTNKIAKLSSSPRLANQLSALEQHLGPIDYRPIDSLKAYANNPRRHPEEQIVRLMASMGEFGFVLPALVDSEGTIIAGEARIEAARRQGVKAVPVIVLDHLSKAQVKAYRLADNRLAQGAFWDEQRLSIEFAEILSIGEVSIDVIGWETAEIDIILDQAADHGVENDPADEAIDPPTSPVSRTGDLWHLGNHRLICGSSLERSVWDRLLEGTKGRMAFVDPPYNVRVSGHVSGLGKTKHSEFAMASTPGTRLQLTSEQHLHLVAAKAGTRDPALFSPIYPAPKSSLLEGWASGGSTSRGDHAAISRDKRLEWRQAEIFGRGWCTTSDENANWVLSIARPPDMNENIEEAKRLLESGLSVSAVSKRLGISWPTNFSKSFARRVGCSPTEWMENHNLRLSTNERVCRAEKLLVIGELPLIEIAQAVGLNSSQALTMAFKSVHGVSPTEWIERQRDQVVIEVMAIPMTHRKKRKVDTTGDRACAPMLVVHFRQREREALI